MKLHKKPLKKQEHKFISEIISKSFKSPTSCYLQYICYSFYISEKYAFLIWLSFYQSQSVHKHL